MAGKSGQSRKSTGGRRGRSVGIQRFGLVLFGALFILLFVGFAIAEGIGQPSVPSGDAAIVKDVPDGTISEAQLKLAIAQQAAQGQLKKAPKPGSDKFEELQKAAMGELLDTIWIKGEAEDLGISVTDKQIEDELANIKKQNFKTAKAYKEFLETSKFTQEDVDKRVELQILSTKIQERISSEAAPASSSAIADYYDAAKASQFTTKPTRDVRIVTNKDKAKIEAAQKALEADNSPASWKKVAVKYSADPSTKSKGGLQAGLSEEILPEPLKGDIFGASTGELVGPIAYQGNYTLIEVAKLNPEKVQTLAEVKSQISTQLTQQTQQEFFSEFVTGYQSKWQSRTFCASGFVTERCSNYVSSGHPSSAPPACYEADPKSKAPLECPAPVAQVSPAIPGTTTVLKPQGERLAQRPRPEGLKEAGAEGLTLPEGAAPPTGE
ncbi:MAG TPA: peptidyl-prolyl cis-trans isomerase [Solirubrobacterales bacterium]